MSQSSTPRKPREVGEEVSRRDLCDPARLCKTNRGNSSSLLCGEPLATKLGLAAIFPFTPAARDRALVAYGPDYAHIYRRAPTYVARILKGAKPADLPVQDPVKFDLIINLRKAKELILTIHYRCNRLGTAAIPSGFGGASVVSAALMPCPGLTQSARKVGKAVTVSARLLMIRHVSGSGLRAFRRTLCACLSP
jgi:ABC transporter substrate binding protein